MSDAPAPDSAHISKTMSLAEHEFVAGCKRLASDGDTISNRQAHFELDRGSVTISYTPLEGVRLGGLLQLPRAEVKIAFADVSAAAQQQFLRKFDQTFQRGGG